MDLHHDVEQQVLRLYSGLFLISFADHQEPVDYEDDSDYELDDDGCDCGEDDYDSESGDDSDYEDDEDSEGETETEGGFGGVAASHMAIPKIKRVNSTCVGAQDEGALMSLRRQMAAIWTWRPFGLGSNERRVGMCFIITTLLNSWKGVRPVHCVDVRYKIDSVNCN